MLPEILIKHKGTLVRAQYSLCSTMSRERSRAAVIVKFIPGDARDIFEIRLFLHPRCGRDSVGGREKPGNISSCS